MIAQRVFKMAGSKRGGAPKTGEPRGSTKSLRVSDDIFEMAYWITEVTGEKSAELLDPMLRAPMTARYEHYRVAIEALKKARGASGKS